MSTSPDRYNASIIDQFRASGGQVGGPWKDTSLLLLHHTGAKSRTARVDPVAYLADGDRYVIVASNGGAPANPAWYHNLKANPEVSIEVGSETIHALASEATGSERQRLFEAYAARYKALTEHQSKTDRSIPVIVLEPAGKD